MEKFRKKKGKRKGGRKEERKRQKGMKQEQGFYITHFPKEHCCSVLFISKKH